MTTNPQLDELIKIGHECNEKLEEIHEAISLSGVDAPPPAGPVVQLSYLLFEQQRGSDAGSFGSALKNLLGDLIVSDTSPGSVFLNREDWTKTQMRWWFGRKSDAVGYVELKFLGMDPDESQYKDGDEVQTSADPFEHQGNGWLVDLSTSRKPLGFSEEETVALENQRSMQMTHTTEIDVGTSEETTVGGNLEGASFEEKIGVTFGYKDAEEEQKAEAESKTKTTSTKIEYECPQHRVTLLTVNSTDINSHTPDGFHGAANYSITIALNTKGIWWHGYGPRMMRHGPRVKRSGDYAIAKFTDIDDFVAAWQGTNADFQGLIDIEISEFAQHQIDLIADGQASRAIDFDGTSLRQYQQGAHMAVADVTGQDLDAVAKEHGIPPGRVVTG